MRELLHRGIYAVNVMVASRNGVPDILCCYQGQFIGIEVKAPGGKVSPVQVANLERIRRNGGHALVAYSWPQVKLFLDSC